VIKRPALLLDVDVKQEPSAFDHDWGAEAVAIKYLHVRVESQARPWRH
jgi:hypothetical protein